MSCNKRYPANLALKNGSASSIESSCIKSLISNEYVTLRDENKRMKPICDKAQTMNDQLVKAHFDNETKLKIISQKCKTIKDHNNHILKQNAKISELENEIQTLKENIDATKTNKLQHLQNIIHKQNEEIKYLKEGYGKFNVEDESLKSENVKLKEEHTQYRMEIAKLKDELNLSKASHKRLTEKIDEIKKYLHRCMTSASE